MDYQDHHRGSQGASRFVSLLSVDFFGEVRSMLSITVIIKIAKALLGL